MFFESQQIKAVLVKEKLLTTTFQVHNKEKGFFVLIEKAEYWKDYESSVF